MLGSRPLLVYAFFLHYTRAKKVLSFPKVRCSDFVVVRLNDRNARVLVEQQVKTTITEKPQTSAACTQSFILAGFQSRVLTLRVPSDCKPAKGAIVGTDIRGVALHPRRRRKAGERGYWMEVERGI
ncbi:hypothetical protein IscW_ISCW012226 [Ixodes scapularis]|uniref:Uncharacterized protein n=1 Tax=Ixodes scapularis TaxID=6945 RepID=B7QF72_IXOSC|nr:hypothetical protein IscW_ISCW012226 [Ixodes scapularis]|eukprot:XP_002414186.1 hypothetical protein IscW_ISCW012226 [Ixodes scapularis]